MKKQLMSCIVCFALLVIMFLGSSIAWFTDEHVTYNEISAGKVSVTHQTAEVLGVGEDEDVFQTVLMPTQTIEQEVTFINDGNQPIYIRTLFAFEDSVEPVDVLETEELETLTVVEYIRLNSPEGFEIVIPGVTDSDPKIQFTVTDSLGGTTLYTLGYYQYPGALSYEDDPEEEPFYYTCLNSITLDGSATSEWGETVGATYEFFVLTQATQSSGFATADEAFVASFGELNAENAATCFGRVLAKTEGWETVVVAQYPAPVVEEPVGE